MHLAHLGVALLQVKQQRTHRLLGTSDGRYVGKGVSVRGRSWQSVCCMAAQLAPQHSAVPGPPFALQARLAPSKNRRTLASGRGAWGAHLRGGDDDVTQRDGRAAGPQRLRQPERLAVRAQLALALTGG